MEWILILGFFLTISLFSPWNGYVIEWKLKNSKLASKIWHKIGWIVRFIPFTTFAIYAWNDYKLLVVLELSYLIIAWVLYDPIINKINNWPLLKIDRKGINEIIIQIMVFILSFGRKISIEKKKKYEKMGVFFINFIKLITIMTTIILTILWWNHLIT